MKTGCRNNLSSLTYWKIPNLSNSAAPTTTACVRSTSGRAGGIETSSQRKHQRYSAIGCWGGNLQRPHDMKLSWYLSHDSILSWNCAMLSIVISYIGFFWRFSTANHFPSVKLCHNLFHLNRGSFQSIHLTFITYCNFLLHFLLPHQEWALNTV